MNGSQFENRSNKTESLRDTIKEQQNLDVKLNTSCKRLFNSLDINSTLKLFWSKCNSCIINKHSKGGSNIFLIENDKNLLKNRRVVVFNSYFQTITGFPDFVYFLLIVFHFMKG